MCSSPHFIHYRNIVSHNIIFSEGKTDIVMQETFASKQIHYHDLRKVRENEENAIKNL